MLNSATITANIPAADLTRARDFYSAKLGLTPSFEMDGVFLLYKTDGGSAFSVYQTEYAGQSGHTIAQWHVDDVATEVRELRANGVTFERYDMPGVSWDDDVASMEGVGKAAWLRTARGTSSAWTTAFRVPE